jgi:hypothetical protein
MAVNDLTGIRTMVWELSTKRMKTSFTVARQAAAVSPITKATRTDASSASNGESIILDLSTSGSASAHFDTTPSTNGFANSDWTMPVNASQCPELGLTDASTTRRSRHPPTQPVLNARSEVRQTGKRKLSSTPAEAISFAARLTAAKSGSRNNLIFQHCFKLLPSTSAARLTESSLPDWPYGEADVATQLGFTLDEEGFKEWSIWTESYMVAPHYQQLRDLVNQGLLICSDPWPLFDTITRMSLRNEEYVTISWPGVELTTD